MLFEMENVLAQKVSRIINILLSQLKAMPTSFWEEKCKNYKAEAACKKRYSVNLSDIKA